ncbi:CCR4-NOT transcription complex subunit 2 [Xenoophorus captivus]|uniref:CCR4-NOT transcription complex subunit 2 n=1 Tax=Xenoophorus captivus TaxID=1517983 RepID=A0ABV0RUK8_9TELE
MGNSTPQLNRNLTQGTQLASHITPTTGVPSMSLHTPPSPSRCVGQGIGLTGRTSSMGSSGLGSPNRSSPSIICMPKQQPARQPCTINR